MDKNRLINLLMSDNSVSYTDKMAILSYLQNISESEASRFPTGSIVGGGIAFAIAKFLLGLGYGGSVISAILGAAMGGMFNSPSIYKGDLNSFRLTDRFGRSI